MAWPFSAIRTCARLSDQGASALEGEIRTDRIQVAEKLPTEALLVQHFQMSLTVVCEAIARVRPLGVLGSRQGSGVYVLAPSIKPLQFDVPLTEPQIEQLRQTFGAHW
ncbi:GntR family transcriptional regulator [Acidovorax sp. JG5]|uniref:GntR family transcriptional regulator n=1 Tax=Acidovorax sp. JG5 TaxID=2822718 RepID=UPI001B339CE0|nr:GntR family transcriptional regulator [Acidovorax sp. JG5]MBP3980007.1 GntR family transcriptional regulator [Acidovorax sp. JG5]